MLSQKRMTKHKLFWISFLGGMVGMLALAFFERRPPRPILIPIASNVFLTSQLEPKTVRFLKTRGIMAIVDLRPDGEEIGQATSAQMESAAKANGMSFHYIPVPHESIPESAVNALQRVLSEEQNRDTVLYCRTGRRAVRTFALAEASRQDGLPEAEILKAVESARFPVDDLKLAIAERISHRNPHVGENNK
jgi:uncharacterized protein (TIGR01244 family)